MTPTDPSGSFTLSSDVATVTVALPLVGTVTVREPVLAPQWPHWPTVRFTVSGCDGAGLAVTVNTASPPSLTRLPAVAVTTGTAGDGVPSRHSNAARNGLQRESPNSTSRASAAVSGVLCVPVAPDRAIHARHQSLRCLRFSAVSRNASWFARASAANTATDLHPVGVSSSATATLALRCAPETL